MKNTQNTLPNKNKQTNLDWDLEAILQGQDFEVLHQAYVKAQAAVLSAYDHGRCYATLQQFRAYVQACDAYAPLANRLWNYIENKLAENVSDTTWTAWRQKIVVADQAFDEALANDVNAIISHHKQISKYLQEPDLKAYSRFYTNILRYQSHVLKPKQEQLLAKLEPDGFDAGSIQQVLSSSDIKYACANTNKKRKIKIQTETQALALLKNPDRTVRKSAWHALQQAFKRYEHVFSRLLYYNYALNMVSIKQRHYRSYLQAQMWDDEVPDDFITFVYAQVKKYSKAYKRFNKLSAVALRKQYKLKRLHAWDQHLELFSCKTKYGVDAGKQLALQALCCLGPDYNKRVQRAFIQNWISWLPKPNKQAGAYSVGGVYGLTKFYILMNYEQTLDSVFTLVHELGHALHSSYLVEHQTIYCGTDTFCAEIASTVNEILLGLYLLETNKKRPKMQAMIYKRILDNFFGATAVQAMYSNLEVKTIDAIANDQAVTPTLLYQSYLQTYIPFLAMKQKDYEHAVQQQRFGGLTNIFRVEHFYGGDLYVYKYAVAMVVAIRVAQLLYQQDQKMHAQYFTFLTLGTSLSPLEIIARLGVDVRKENVWEAAGAFVEQLVQAYAALLTRLKLR